MLSASPAPTFRGRFDERAATRLLWRAGFGPRPGEARRLARLGLDGAVASLTRPAGGPRLVGPEPTNSHNQPLDPINVWGDAHCWWLDRMVRSSQPLMERMTLIWHSWFATSLDAATAQLMLDQNRMMRASALGNFGDLLLKVTTDPAMLLFLNGADNTKWSPNENYAREMLELFTLGADRGYTQADVHQNALALTGFTVDWSTGEPTNFRFDPSLHDTSTKTIFGQRGNFDYRDSCRLAVTHSSHPSFFVTKLWGSFIAEPIPAATARALERLYTDSGLEIRPVVEAILRHPLLYSGQRMVLPPVVLVAGLLRATRQGIHTDDWAWICQQAGQLLFDPPNVAGWNDADWLDTARWSGRLTAVNWVLEKKVISADHPYDVHESAHQALERALAFWGRPAISAPTRQNLLAYARRVESSIHADWEASSYRALRQNGLRALIAMTPDCQTA